MSVGAQQETIESLKVIVQNLDTAINSAALDPTGQYSFDDGQTRVSVTRRKLDEMINQRMSLARQICILESNLVENGGGITQLINERRC